MIDFESYADFDSASTAVLAYLQERTGLKLWMTTRTTEPNWIVLNAADKHYDVKAGDVFQWSDSYCSRMVRGEGPLFAPVAEKVESYVEAPINQAVPIKSYIGVPILMGDGKLFGTLCGIDPEPIPPQLESEMALVKMFANLLGLIAERDLRLLDRDKTIDKVRNEAERDKLTGLYNRRGWEARLTEQETQARRYGSPICVLILDLDELKTTNDTLGHQAGDQMIVNAANCLKSVVRPNDVVARIGGDEFAVLTNEIDQESGEALCHRVMEALQKHDVKASVGLAIHDPRDLLADTVHAADEAMYEMKTRRNNKPNLATASLQNSISYLNKQRNAVANQARNFQGTGSLIVHLVASK